RGEVEQLFAVIRELRDAGVAVLFVSHFLDQVYEISDRMTVLRNGRRVGEYLTADFGRHQLVTAMLGRELELLDEIAETAQETHRNGMVPPIVSTSDIGR